MGTSATAWVDTAALRGIAREFDTAASIVDGAVRRHLVEFDFGGATAGRSYAAHRDAVRTAVAGVGNSLRQWSCAAAEIAAALRASADRYADTDLAAAGRIG